MTKVKKQKFAIGTKCWYDDRFQCELIKKHKYPVDVNKYWEIRLLTENGKKYSNNTNLIVPESALSFEKKDHGITVLFDKFKDLKD